MMVSYIKDINKVEVTIIIKMGISMKVSGKMIAKMEKGNSIMESVMNIMKEIGLTEKNMDSVNIYMLPEITMKANGD